MDPAEVERRTDTQMAITTVVCKTNHIFQDNKINMAKVPLETRVFRVDISIVFRIIPNWQLKEGACSKMVEDTSETMVKTAIWTFSKSSGITFTIGCVTAIKLMRWITQLKWAKTINHSIKKVKWLKIKWVKHSSSKKEARIQSTKTSSIIRMQHKIFKAIRLVLWMATSLKRWIQNLIRGILEIIKRALSQWFPAIQMMRKANLIARSKLRKKVINIWYCRWDKAMTRCKISCWYNTSVRMPWLYSIIQVPFNFKSQNKCFTLWKRNLVTWKQFCHRKKTRWPRWMLKMVKIKMVAKQIKRENHRVLTTPSHNHKVARSCRRRIKQARWTIMAKTMVTKETDKQGIKVGWRHRTTWTETF